MMKAQRKRTKLGTSIIAVFSAVMILLSGCEKKPNEETVLQTFGINIYSNESIIRTKSWNPDEWIYNYATTPATLTLTGVDNEKVYTANCTISQLIAGTVTINMLQGTYNVSYVTPHKQSENIWSLNSLSISSIGARAVGDVLDIAINQQIYVSGTPITLNATLDDALIIVDIPDVDYVLTSLIPNLNDQMPKLLKENTYHYAYVNNGRYLKLYPNFTEINLSDLSKGNAYHIVTDIGASVNLIIPDMEVISVEL